MIKPHDLRYAIRTLRKQPGFTAAAVCTLALGVGANAAIFSLAHAVLTDLVPYEAPQELVRISESALPDYPVKSVAYPNYVDWRARSTSFAHLVAHRSEHFNLTGGDVPERIFAVQASSEMFDLVRVAPLLGRGFTAAEDVPGSPKVVVLSHALWQAQFAGDDAAIGQHLMLDGAPYEVVGVMPEGFSFPISFAPVRAWLPIGHFASAWQESRGNHPGIHVTGRLAEGVSLEEAVADLESIAGALAEAHPATNAGHSVIVKELQDYVLGDTKPALMVLSASVVLVLLIACVNVANLLLVRAVGRAPEIALRSALGARRLGLVRQLLTESALLAAAGGLAGTVLAYALLDFMVEPLGIELPALSQASLNGSVFPFALLCALGTALLFGLAPALFTVKAGIASNLREGRHTTIGRGGRRFRDGLVVAEVALALVLLVCAGLFLRSFVHLGTADPGFEAENVFLVDLSLAETARPTAEEQRAFFDQILARVRMLPDVTAASYSLPVLGGMQLRVNAEGKPNRTPEPSISAEVFRVDTEIFETLGLRISDGRLLEPNDGAGAKRVAVVDERFATALFPGEPPIGKRFLFGSAEAAPTAPDGAEGTRPIPLEERWIEIVGVVEHVKSYGVANFSRMQVYLPMAQNTLPFTTLVFKTEQDPLALHAAIARAIRDVDPAQPVGEVERLSDRMVEYYGTTRAVAMLLVAFAGLATLLAALGIYGVMAYAASQRRQEIGIRMALGADHAAVQRLLVTQGMRLVALGLLIGISVVFLLGPTIRSQLFEVSPREPAMLGLVPLLLALVALLACLVPAKQAARTDVVASLRSE